MRQSNKMKTPAVFRVALALLCLALLTCNMMSDIYARYSASATGSASARVAKFDCSVSGKYGGNKYSVTVTNNSEVTVKYSVACEDLPTGVILNIQDENGDSISENNRIISPNDTVSFVVAVTENYEEKHERIESELSVIIEQVD